MPSSEMPPRPSWRVLDWVLWAVRLAAGFAFLWAVNFEIDGSANVAILMAVFMGLMAGAVFNSCIAFVWQVCDHGTPALLQWGVWAFQLVVMVLIVSHNAAYHWTPNGYVAGL